MFLKSKQVPLEFSSLEKKFKKYHKIKYKNQISSIALKRGGSSLLIRDHSSFTPKQLLAIIKILKPALKTAGKQSRVLLDLHVDTIVTKKAKDIRMGRGKGTPSDKVSLKRAGSILQQVFGLSINEATRLNQLCSTKIIHANYINAAK
jgi:ribosomal protein L16/L10AE